MYSKEGYPYVPQNNQCGLTSNKMYPYILVPNIRVGKTLGMLVDCFYVCMHITAESVVKNIPSVGN
jgi:hypothetical protein